MILISKELAHFIYSKYSSQPGSREIASLLALEHISTNLLYNNIHIVLELGGGIGTITELCLRTQSTENVITFEDNDFCVEVLNVLKREFPEKLEIITKLEKLHNFNAQMMIIDYPIHFEFLKSSIVNNRETIQIIIVEGNRYFSRLSVCYILLLQKKTFTITTFVNKNDDREALFILKITKQNLPNYFISFVALLKLIPRYFRLQCRYLISRHKILKYIYSHITFLFRN